MTTLWAILAMSVAGDPAPSDPRVFFIRARGADFGPAELVQVESDVRGADVQVCGVVASSAPAAWSALESVLRGSEVVRERIRKGNLRIQAVLQEAVWSPMEWLGSHPDQSRLLSSSVRAARPTRSFREEPIVPSRAVSRNLLLVMPGLLLLGAGVMMGVAYTRRKEWRPAALVKPEEALAQM